MSRSNKRPSAVMNSKCSMMAGIVIIVALGLWYWLSASNSIVETTAPDKRVPSRSSIHGAGGGKLRAASVKIPAYTPPVTTNASWQPFTALNFQLAPDIGAVLDLKPDELRKLARVSHLLMDRTARIHGEIEFHVGALNRQPKDPRASGKSAEFGIYLPANQHHWIVAERQFKEGLENAVGPAKAAFVLERSAPLLAAATGDFGRYPRIATVVCFSSDEHMSYRYCVRTGAPAVIEIMGAGFTPGGAKEQELEAIFNPSSAVGLSAKIFSPGPR